MKCSKCNAELQPTDELRWECNSCHQMCRANLPMLEQIQAQRDHGYTAAMVNCPFCGTVLDDGNETIHWNCASCGEQTTGTIKNYLKPELLEEVAAPIAEESSDQSEFAWIDADGEEMEAPPAEKPSPSKGFFADEEAKNEFLAETTSQALGEEIPDSIFEDAFPIHKKSEEKPAEVPAENATGIPENGAADAISGSPFVEPPTSTPPAPPASQPVEAPTNSVTDTISGSPFVEPPTSTPTVPAASQSAEAPTSSVTDTISGSSFVEPPTSTPTVPPASQPAEAPTSSVTDTISGSPFVEPPTSTPTVPASSQPVETPTSSATDTISGSPFVEPPTSTPTVPASSQPVEAPTSTPTAPASQPAETPASTASEPSVNQPAGASVTTADTSAQPPQASGYSYTEPPVKQRWPKILTGILGVMIAAAVIVGVFFTVSYLIAPTRQFRNAVKVADYTKAMEIYDNKIKGDVDDERIAQIAVEHYLHEAFKALKDGTGDEAAYEKILDFAQNEMRIKTTDYELAAETTATPAPSESPAPVGEAEATASPETVAEMTATPEATAESTPEVTEEPAAVTTEPVAEPTEAPAQAGDTQITDTGEDVTAAIAQAKEYVKKKKYEKAYNYLADYKEADTTGQVEKEMTSIKKKWKSYNIKTFKALCDKLTIVYYASEKRYHIVPRGYYTNYNQICRSNNVGGIAYMDQKKKKVSITNIGKTSALSSFGKNNRANLKKFKAMIEKYPYLAKEI